MADQRSPSRPLTRSKKILFTGVFLLFSLVLACGVLLAVDLYWHKKFPVVPNYRGYRGPVAAHKQPNEIRLIVAGGSTALGYGVQVQEAFPAYLEQDLRARLPRPVSVINLAWNNQGAYSFVPTMEDYAYLDYDGVILYEGYNDLRRPNQVVFRRESPVFRAVGYYPVIPMIVREKWMIVKHGKDLEKAYVAELKKKAAFKPVAAPNPEAAAMLAKNLREERATKSDDCATFGFYCNSMKSAVQYALDHHKKVFVVTQPYAGDRHREQQKEMLGMLERRFHDPNMHYINLGDAINLRDPSLAFDGMHLYPRGNKIIADRLSDAIAPLLH